MDVDRIPAGADFVKQIESELANCEIFLALIGPRWLQIQNLQGTSRLFDPNDFVTNEIDVALRRGINVIPILIDGAPMPGEGDLPEAIKPLARRNAVELKNTQFKANADRLVDELSDLVNRATEGTKRRYYMIGGGSLLGIAVSLFFAAGIWWWPKKADSVEGCGLQGQIEKGQTYSGVFTGIVVDSGQSGAPIELKLVRDENSVNGAYFRAGICGNVAGHVADNRMAFSWNWADSAGKGTAIQNGDSLSGTSGFKDATEGSGTFILFLRK